MSFKIYGMLALGVGGFVAMDSFDTSTNYSSVEASVTKVKTDCYIEKGRTKIVRDGSSSLAYMDCDAAPHVARQNGMDRSDIHRRAMIKFTYRSPVDDSRQTGTHTEKDVKEHEYRRGKRMTIYAHIEKPSKYKIR